MNYWLKQAEKNSLLNSVVLTVDEIESHRRDLSEMAARDRSNAMIIPITDHVTAVIPAIYDFENMSTVEMYECFLNHAVEVTDTVGAESERFFARETPKLTFKTLRNNTFVIFYDKNHKAQIDSLQENQ